MRATIGLDRARWIVCGAAPFSSDVHRFLLDLGLPMVELYGMSETSNVLTASSPEQARTGTVGKGLPGVEYKVADDGELLIRGAIVMAGYRNDPERTAEVLDADGWLHSGDIVEIDDEGYVKIVDRKKELIKRHTVLHEEWLPGGDELTPTMKLKRKPISAKYTGEIRALYA